MAALFGVDCRTMHPPLTVKERNDFPLRSNPPFSCADVTGVLLFQLVIGRPKFPPTTSQLTEEALAALKPDRYGVPVAASVSKEIFWVSRVNKGSLSLDGRLYYIEPVLKNPTFRSVPYNLGGGPFPVVQMNAFASFSPPDAPGDWDAGEEKAAAFFAEAEVWAKENRGRDKPPIAERYIRHWADAVRGDALRPSEWVSEVYVPWVSVLKHQLAWDIKHREEIMKAWPEYEFPPEAGVSKM
ncbi:MAG: hypothetical protein M1829_000291 [Trizodia sp. TS-e1964]|nr:MAG: hypothetical protein M1829_000291 [Trizodia sp. TS-e1964]